MREPFHNARVFVVTLLILEVCIGVAIIIVTSIYHQILGSYMVEMDRQMLFGQFFNTYILGFQLTIVYLVSIAMWQRIWKGSCSAQLPLIVGIWMFFCFLIFFCGFGTIWTLLTCADALQNAVETSLLRGIDLYYSCPEWKLLWDNLQYRKECCGAHNYRDWMQASWMPTEVLQNESNNDCSGQEKQIILAPYACCKQTCNTCYETYIPRSGNNGIPYLNLTQINIHGCLAMFSHSMWQIIYGLIALVLIAFKLDLIICCILRYIIKKQRNAGLEEYPLIISQCAHTLDGDILQEETLTNVKMNEANAFKREEAVRDSVSRCSEVRRGYAIRQEVTQRPVRQTNIHLCDCDHLKTKESRILH